MSNARNRPLIQPPGRFDRLKSGPARWATLVAFASLIGVALHLTLRPPLIPVQNLDHPESLDPQVRSHLDEILALARTQPRDSSIRATLGIACAANGLWTEARQAFLDTGRLSPGEPLAPLYAAVALQELSDTAGALKEFRSLVARFPDFAPGWYRVGEASLRAGELEAAETAFQRLTQLAPAEWRGPAGLGEIRVRQGRATDAVPLLERAISLDRSSKPAQYLLGQAYRAVGRTNEARIAIAAGTGEARQPMPDPWGDAAPNHVRALPDLLVQADGLSTTGRPDLAVQLLKQAVPFHPGHAGLLNQLAVALNRSGKAAQALPILNRLITQDLRAVAPRITRVYTHDLMGNAAAGLQDAHEAIQLAPRLSQAHLALADSLLALERDAEAVAALEEAAKCDPGNAEIHVELGEILWRNLSNKAAALTHLRQAIDLNPALVRAYGLLGQLEMELGGREAARQAAMVLRQLAPDSQDRIELERVLARP